MKKITIQRVAQWLRIMIANTAALPDDPTPANNGRVYTVQRSQVMDKYEWRLENDQKIHGTSIAAKWMARPDATTFEQAITVDISPWGRALGFAQHGTPDELHDQIIHLDGHPRLQHGPTMLTLACPKSGEYSRSSLGGIVTKWAGLMESDHQTGLGKVIGRLQRQRQVNPVLAHPLQSAGLSRLLHNPWGITAYQHFFGYRLTLGALTLRDREGGQLPCPFDFCAQLQPATETHILWDCVGAQAYWMQLLRRWQPSFTEATTPATAAQHIFGPTEPVPAPTLRQAVEMKTQHAHVIARTMADAWHVITHSASQQLWLLRNDAAFNAKQPSRTEHLNNVSAAVNNQLAALSTGLLQYPETRDCGAVVETIRQRIQQEPQHTDQPRLRVRMSFDGGSRGNPGHTGAGSVIMEADGDADWSIVWWDAHYMGDAHTNNEAEHTSLLRGVAECVRRYENTPTQILIIGDSQLILDQAAGSKRCHKHALRATCHQTQDQLRRLPDYTLLHTLRAGNKMADLLANRAMDMRCTTTSTDTLSPLYADLDALRSNDLSATWTHRQGPRDLLHHLLQRQQEPTHHRTVPKRRHLQLE